MQDHAHTSARRLVHTQAHAYTHKHTHAHTSTRMHTQAHACTHKHTHAHTFSTASLIVFFSFFPLLCFRFRFGLGKLLISSISFCSAGVRAIERSRAFDLGISASTCSSHRMSNFCQNTVGCEYTKVLHFCQNTVGCECTKVLYFCQNTVGCECTKVLYFCQNTVGCEYTKYYLLYIIFYIF